MVIRIAGAQVARLSLLKQCDDSGRVPGGSQHPETASQLGLSRNMSPEQKNQAKEALLSVTQSE